MAEGMPQETDWLQEGTKVEMRSDLEGYQGAWFTVKIIKLLIQEELRPKKKNQDRVCLEVVVEHLHFTESSAPDSKKLQETVKKDQLRPLPPKLPHKQWKVRDAVETWHASAWWIGFIKHYNAKKDTYLVCYGRGYEDLEIVASNIRSRQDYVQPSASSQYSWNFAAAMQKPANWVKNKETQLVARTQSRAKGSSTHSKRCESDNSQDEDWEPNEEKRKKKTKLGVR